MSNISLAAEAPAEPWVVGPRSWGDREIYWTGKVAIGIRYEPCAPRMTTQCVELQDVLLSIATPNQPRPQRRDNSTIA